MALPWGYYGVSMGLPYLKVTLGLLYLWKKVF